MSQRRITMQMIADASGYSKYVVSKTLNGKEGVSESTRQKVLSVAKQLGYFKSNQVNWQNFGKEKNYKIENKEGFVLVVMPNHRNQNADSLYWSQVFDAIVDSLESSNIGVIVISSKNNLSSHVKTRNLLGVITVGLVSSDMLLELNKHNVPIVMVDHEDSIIKADTIFMDNRDGIYKLTNYLVGLGHKHLMFVGDNSWSHSFYDRWLGFKTALERNNLYTPGENYIIDLDYASNVTEQISAHLNKLKNSNLMPTALVCANDNIAEHVMDLLIKKGYSIPGDCSVTGFDNLDNVSKHTPALTSIEVLKASIGRRAVKMLFWRLENAEFPPEKIQVYCEMIIRESVHHPPQKR